MDALFVLSGLAFWVVFLLAIVFVAIFPLWMLIHAVIRTIKLWPDEAVLNVLFLVLIWFTNFIGAIVYYFVCYRNSAAHLKQVVN